jgi:hypothetical protein
MPSFRNFASWYTSGRTPFVDIIGYFEAIHANRSIKNTISVYYISPLSDRQGRLWTEIRLGENLREIESRGDDWRSKPVVEGHGISAKET